MPPVNNGFSYFQNPGVIRGGSAISTYNGNWAKAANRRNFYGGEGTVIAGASIANKSGWPSGYVHPYCVSMAQKGGGMATFNTILGAGEISGGNLAGGRNADADLTGSGAISNAALALIVSAVAALAGSGTVTGAILGKLEAVADLSGSGDLTAALGALASLLADLEGQGTIDADILAKGYPSADLTVTGATLTTANVADAVWSAIAETGYSYQDVIKILAAVAAGKTTIVPGLPTEAAVTFRDLSDTKDVVVADMVESERVDVTITP